MTQQVSDLLKELNKNFFNDHIDEVTWNSEKVELKVKMNTKDHEGNREEFVFKGDEAKMIYKKLA